MQIAQGLCKLPVTCHTQFRCLIETLRRFCFAATPPQKSANNSRAELPAQTSITVFSSAGHGRSVYARTQTLTALHRPPRRCNQREAANFRRRTAVHEASQPHFRRKTRVAAEKLPPNAGVQAYAARGHLSVSHQQRGTRADACPPPFCSQAASDIGVGGRNEARFGLIIPFRERARRARRADKRRTSIARPDEFRDAI